MKHYIDIEHYKEKFKDSFQKGDEITITEKIDGSNASFEKGENGLIAYSRTQILTEKDNLRGFYNYVKSLPQDILDNHPDYVVFGEWLIKHTVSYPSEKMQNFYVFDIWNKKEEKWCLHKDVVSFCEEKHLTMVPVFYIGKFKSWEHINSFVGKTQMGGEHGEGVVVKNMGHYQLPYNSRNITHTKIVDERFKEKMKKHEKVIDPAKEAEKERILLLTQTIVTYPRIIKMLHKLEDEGVLKEDWNSSDMKTIAQNLPKRIFEDCIKEEKEVVDIIGKDFGSTCGKVTMSIAKDILDKKQTMTYEEILTENLAKVK